MKDQAWSRREFLTSAGVAAAGLAGASSRAANDPQAVAPGKTPPAAPSSGHGAAMMDETALLKSYHIWDVHTHLNRFAGDTIEAKVADCLRFADRMGVERMLVLTAGSGGGPEPGLPDAEGLRKMNDVCIAAVKTAPDRLFGCAFMNPTHLQACLDEINRCVRDGPLVGLKFEDDTIRHPGDVPGMKTYGTPRSLEVLDPIFARAGELKAVIMHHTFMSTLGPQNPGESTTMEIVEVAKRHPNTSVFVGHIGGNWELGGRPLRGVKNCYGDLSGSDPTSGYVEMMVRELGAEHVMYGSDIEGRSFASQLSKVLGANISDSDRRLILGGNMRRVMEPVMKARGMKA
jgi:hypothetical protein